MLSGFLGNRVNFFYGVVVLEIYLNLKIILKMCVVIKIYNIILIFIYIYNMKNEICIEKKII